MAVLHVRLRRTAPVWIARRATAACPALLVAVGAEVYLTGWLNPTARDAAVAPAVVRAESIAWAASTSSRSSPSRPPSS